VKYYLDISKEEQAKRLKDRAKDPLKQWKISPIDQKAQKMWNAYSDARDKMLKQTNSSDAPWTVINANDKKLAHLNLIADLLSRVDYPDKDKKILKIDPKIVLTWAANSKKLPKLSP
jgi:polyphosphate kinase 2 (PPK2 family)